MTGVVVLGATGSVGTRAAEVLAERPDRFRVVGLSAARNGKALLEQALGVLEKQTPPPQRLAEVRAASVALK